MNDPAWVSVYRSVYGDHLEGAVAELVNGLSASENSPFKAAAASSFSNPPAQVSQWLQSMSLALSQQTELAFIYVEMNGFDINYDRWFCDAMGYSRSIEIPNPMVGSTDVDVLDELSNVDAHLHWKQALTLSGMEQMQEAFRWFYEDTGADRRHEAETELAILLVQCRFLILMREAVGVRQLSPHVPVAAATHDSDLVV